MLGNSSRLHSGVCINLHAEPATLPVPLVEVSVVNIGHATPVAFKTCVIAADTVEDITANSMIPDVFVLFTKTPLPVSDIRKELCGFKCTAKK